MPLYLKILGCILIVMVCLIYYKGPYYYFWPSVFVYACVFEAGGGRKECVKADDVTVTYVRSIQEYPLLHYNYMLV